MAKRSTPAPDPRRAIAHVRVSTDEQQLGQEAQRAAIADWAARHGVEIMAWTQDVGVSGGAELEDRPGLGEAMALMVEHDAGTLIVAKRDRLARSVAVAVAVERAVTSIGGRVVSADGIGLEDSPEAKLVRTILDAVAEYERMIIRMRIRAAARVAAERKQLWGSVPFGWLAGPGKTLIAHTGEQAIIARIFALKNDGIGYERIAAALNKTMPSKQGGKWYATTVRRIYLAEEARRKKAA